MELELQHQTLEGYCPVCHAMLGQEETLESIVPDSFPDMARIVSAAGKAFLKDKETADGTLRLTGAVCVTVLYIPEDEEQARALDVTIPFQCVKDYPQIRDGMQIHGMVTVAASDARIINPRKVLVRSSLLCSVTVYGNERQELTCDITGGREDCVEKQINRYKSNVITEIVEKPFLFSDVLRQAASKPAMDELCSYRAELGTMEGKVIGKKLVCKGDILLSVLYRSGSAIVPARFELPYSQIVELMGGAEEGTPELMLALKSVDCRLQDGELEVSVEALVQGCIWVQKPVTLLSDTYCTAYPLEVERTTRALCVMAEQGMRRETARQFCPSGIPGKQVLDCCAAVESAVVEKGENGCSCKAQLNVDILYLSEDDALCGVNYSIPVSCDIPASEGGVCRCSCRPFGEAAAVPVTGGLEVRSEVEFSWVVTQNENAPCVNTVKPGAAGTQGSPRPSVVIRMVNAKESLWEIAKACGSTVKDICSANSLPSDAVPEGTVLLIPAKRV